ncbi:efflux RND transporter periplasmic adaptor subunit [Ottowia sp.]|uniref:efflux RND transporter periplasmic adaptor subunit n=1 Tax=Ottowia sp. TaxID=1898956 RepID=UPI00394B47DD
MTKRMLIMIGAVIVLIAALAGGKYLQIRKLIASIPKPQPQTVSTIEVQAQPWQSQLKSVGTLSPVRGADLASEVAGLVRSVNFKSGQDVPAGALLVQLSADSDAAQLQALQAAADQAETALKRDQAQLAVRAVSQAQVDADTSNLKAARAQVAQQAANVAKKAIRAPFAGRLGITALQPGQYVNAGATLVTLQTLDPIHVDFSLPQQQLAGLAVGQAVTLAVDAFAGQSFAGTINAINPKVDPATRTVQVQATVANPRRDLLPGMFAEVRVNLGSAQPQLTLPQTAITYNPYGSTVFVVEKASAVQARAAASAASAAPAATAAATPPAPAASAANGEQLVAQQVFVETGPTRGDQVAITKGLTAGQQVVSSGQIKLKNGTPVVVDNRVQPANNPNPTPQEK